MARRLTTSELQAPDVTVETPLTIWNGLPRNVKTGIEWVTIQSWANDRNFCIKVAAYRVDEIEAQITEAMNK